MRDNIVIKICGSAGDGSISAVEILNRAAASMGFHIMNFDSFPAEIRGFGKSCGLTRISCRRTLTPGAFTDCLVSLNDSHSITELPTLYKNSVIVYDHRPGDFLEEDQAIAGFIEPGMIRCPVPLRDLSAEAAKSAKARNIVALGAIAALYSLRIEDFLDAIQTRFSTKNDSIQASNIQAFQLGYEYVRQNVILESALDFHPEIQHRSESAVIISGNEAAATACLNAGIRLYAGYPITPATRIMEILAKKLPLKNGVVVQTEDEISAIGHVVGAGFAGARSATATSGPGFCLMSECISLAVMAEIPAVVINCQRGGPSTGLPTKTEQSDLNIAVYGGSGDSPRPVLAPTNVEECYSITKCAFDVAEAFQTPVIVLLDFFLCNRIEDLEPSIFKQPVKFSFHVPQEDEPEGPYLRYRLNKTGISSRTIPGMPDRRHAITGLEHNQNGRPNYEPDNHIKMTEKRYRKLQTLLSSWPAPETIGSEKQLDIGLISWGATTGAAIEAISLLQDAGLQAGGWFPRLLFPLNVDSLITFSKRSRILAVAELNHTGQFASMIEQHVQRPVIRAAQTLAQPMTPEYIVQKVQGR